MRAETLKRIERLEREKALKSMRTQFIVCSEDQDISELVNDNNNITYVILKIWMR